MTAFIETATTPSVADVVITPARSRDLPALLELHHRCSPESLRFRYLSAYVPDEATLRSMLAKTETLVAWYRDRVVAMGNLSLNGDVAELALLVDDEWQGRGLGGRLGDLLAAVAVQRGATTMSATTAGGNRRVHRLMAHIGMDPQVEYVSGTAYVTCTLPGARSASPSRAVRSVPC